MGDIHAAPPIVRIHSQCLTGDVFHSLRCDCRQQFELAMTTITDAGAGISLYEQQEGRGMARWPNSALTSCRTKGLDTIQANLELGYEADCRHFFELPAAILKQMGLKAVRLITNNPEKVEALELAGNLQVVERISAEVPPEPTPTSATSPPSAKKWATSSAKASQHKIHANLSSSKYLLSGSQQ